MSARTREEGFAQKADRYGQGGRGYKIVKFVRTSFMNGSFQPDAM